MNAAPMQPGFAASLWSAEPSTPTGLRAWNGSDPARRFAVYRNNVRATLAAALAEAFPVLRALLGEEFFLAMAIEYVQAHPPGSPVLIEYGQGFGDFIAQFAPAGALSYLPDVARLEQLRVQSFHAADAPALQSREFEAFLAKPESLPDLRLRVHPSLRLLRSPFAVLSLWLAHQHPEEAARDEALAALDLGNAEDIVIWRPQFDVHVAALPPGAFECLLALQRGETLGAALQAASSVPGFELQTIFQRLVHDGLLTDIIQ